jgi:hypothetical protein
MVAVAEEVAMAKVLAEMTVDELRKVIEEIIEETVEGKLIEFFGDPDEGLELRESFRERLRLQRERVAAGEQGVPAEEVARRLGIS